MDVDMQPYLLIRLIQKQAGVFLDVFWNPKKELLHRGAKSTTQTFLPYLFDY